MAERASVLRGNEATLHERAKWRVGEHQGEVGELTVAILDEEGHWVALSMGEVIGAGEEACRRASVVHELARGGSGEIRGVVDELCTK